MTWIREALTRLPEADRDSAAALRARADDILRPTGALARLKICGASDCQFVYWDHSRSRTSRWCSTEVCGNR